MRLRCVCFCVPVAVDATRCLMHVLRPRDSTAGVLVDLSSQAVGKCQTARPLVSALHEDFEALDAGCVHSASTVAPSNRSLARLSLSRDLEALF